MVTQLMRAKIQQPSFGCTSILLLTPVVWRIFGTVLATIGQFESGPLRRNRLQVD